MEEAYTKYEKARMLGSRALQIAMGWEASHRYRLVIGETTFGIPDADDPLPVKDPKNVVHRVQLGHYMGQSEGRITEIDESAIFLVEIIGKFPTFCIAKIPTPTTIAKSMF